MWPGAQWVEADAADHGMDPAALDELSAYVFNENFNTQALAVFKDGYLVGEWYAEDDDASSLVTSWSMAKSVTSALVGVGIRDGLLSLEDTVGQHIPAWSDGPNADVNLRHMLTMQSGLPENTSNRQGIYVVEPDQLAYALDRELVRTPGEVFQYVNEDSMVLGGVLANAFGQSTVELAEQEIFGPLGISAEWWVDGSGNALTYCCLDSTARDLARFGLLYARGGEWDGTQIIPADFVADSVMGHSSRGAYGLHWWVESEFDAFAAVGLYSQYVWVKPDADLVVVRFGKYTRMGSEAVRTGGNYHDTERDGGFSPAAFGRLIVAALVE
jgi:CubicO group peptidase (beta-lactamase class C family)